MGESLSSVKIQPRGKRSGNLLVCISTRSTTRMYFHQNSSAVSRSDPVSSKPVTDAAESVDAFLSLSCSDASRVSSIKDLRMKRIFTPEVNSVADEETEGENEERKKLKVSDSGRVADPDADSVKVNEFEKLGLLKSGVEDGRNVTANGLNSGNGSKMALNRCNSRKVFKAASSFSYRRMLPYLMDMANDASCVSKIEIVDGVNSEIKIGGDDLKPSENQDIQVVHIQKGRENHMNDVGASMEEEHIQTTPPDPGMFAKTMLHHGAESLEVNKLLPVNQSFMGLKSPNTKCNTNSMNKSVLNPCSRLRLFNNTRSLSYRRLLPFLMDISKDNSCATMNTQHPILQNSVLEKDNYVEKNEAENSCEKQITQDLASSMAPLPLSDNSSLDTNDVLLSSLLASNVVTSETVPEEISQTQSSTSQSEPFSISNNDVLTKQCASEEPESVGKQKMCLDTGLELHNRDAESIEKVGLNQNSFEVKASSDISVCPNDRPNKGILKRNPLGCRGLCNCLNCASFRLHADRAFEFSRNQMHNAEEIASELMEELANIRILLEKSITKNHDSVDIQLNPNLVKQACDRALEAENLAKERLIELNYDLGVHCRIPALVQPKVTFADNIQERATRGMGPSTS